MNRFTYLNERGLKAWAEELMSEPFPVVAISRKGPRLLELLAHEGVLPHSFLKRVISERALPMLSKRNEKIFLIDDTVCWGSTFSRVYKFAKSSHKIVGVPFAINSQVNFVYRELIDKAFLKLDPNGNAAFVNNEVKAFKSLTKPFDIEFPIAYLTGDFNDYIDVSVGIEQCAIRLNGQLIELHTEVPMSKDTEKRYSWTILLPQSIDTNFATPDISKVRIYYDEKKKTISLTVINPTPVSLNYLIDNGNFFPEPLDDAWMMGKEQFLEGDLASENSLIKRSLVSWANYLNALPLLGKIISTFEIVFDSFGTKLHWEGPTDYDLQLLIGFELATEFKSTISSFLRDSDGKIGNVTSYFPTLDKEILIEKFPKRNDLVEKYKVRLESFLDKSESAHEALQAIFYAQHKELEIPSRGQNDDELERLDFGLSFHKIVEDLVRAVPDTNMLEIHKALDSIIDQGSIVPRYLNMSVDDNEEIWARAFRVGEGPLEKVANTIMQLFKKLQEELGTVGVPRLVFEKYCCLALDKNIGIPGLSPIHAEFNELLCKRFHLYGARMAVSFGGAEIKFLLDWALKQKLVETDVPESELDEGKGNYNLGDASKVYLEMDNPLDSQVLDFIEDLAEFVALLSGEKGLKGRALVLLTSLGSDREFLEAIEAELYLWLHDSNFSVYHSIQVLDSVAQKYENTTLTANDLDFANDILYHSANFTAQVAVKDKLVRDREVIYDRISNLVSSVKNSRRIWRDIQKTFDSRSISEIDVSGLPVILSTLRIVYRTNSLLRDLLLLSGYKDQYGRKRELKESIQLLLDLVNKSGELDSNVKDILENGDGRKNILYSLQDLSNNLPLDFPKAYEKIKEIVFDIAECCEQILRDFGSAINRETPTYMDPPKYILMWDVKDFSKYEGTDKDNVDKLIEVTGNRIGNTFSKRVFGFDPKSKDDGNGLVCESFKDVLNIFKILKEVSNIYQKQICAGVEVNTQGLLKYYPKSKKLGGRAFEHAARVATFFKEISKTEDNWNKDIPKEPGKTYLVVGEFARRFAEKVENAWDLDNYGLNLEELDGIYSARVANAIPISISILT